MNALSTSSVEILDRRLLPVGPEKTIVGATRPARGESTSLVQRWRIITLDLAIALLLAGCTVNKVAVVDRGVAGMPSRQSGTIRTYARFSDIGQDYRIQGTIRTGILPLARNKEQAREALLQEAAAGLGVDSLVGLTSLEEGWGTYAESCAILVNTRAEPSQYQPTRPKCVVCMLPARVKTDKTKLASKLEPYLTSELRFHLAEKGYYAYRCSSASADWTGLPVNKETLSAFQEPLGVVPDFVLTCEVSESSDLARAAVKALLLHVVLYDLQQGATVWEDAQTLAGWSLVDAIVDPKGEWAVAAGGKGVRGVHAGVSRAAKTLPLASGYRELKK